MRDRIIAGRLSDEELADAMMPGDPRGLAVVRRMQPDRRALYEHMLWVAGELSAGRTPPGVIV